MAVAAAAGGAAGESEGEKSRGRKVERERSREKSQEREKSRQKSQERKVKTRLVYSTVYVVLVRINLCATYLEGHSSGVTGTFKVDILESG